MGLFWFYTGPSYFTPPRSACGVAAAKLEALNPKHEIHPPEAGKILNDQNSNDPNKQKTRRDTPTRAKNLEGMITKWEGKSMLKKNTGVSRQKTGERQRQEEWNGGRMQEEDRIPQLNRFHIQRGRQKSEDRRQESEDGRQKSQWR
jgi:hypothetical protein